MKSGGTIQAKLRQKPAANAGRGGVRDSEPYVTGSLSPTRAPADRRMG